MKKQSCRLVKLFLLMTFALLLITACHQTFTQRPDISLKPSAECRIIQHDFGETCVPLKPQRIVTLSPENNLDALIALGIKPVGYTSYDILNKGKQSLFGASLDAVAGAEYVGNVYQPSFEKILLLKPDLILLSLDAHLYESLSAIAPTVSVPSPFSDLISTDQAFFKQNLRYIAKLLNQESRSEEILKEYEERINQLREKLGRQLQQLEIAVIFYGEDVIYTINNQMNSLIPSIFNDIGLRYKFLSSDRNLMKPPLSIETIREYDADILFIINIAERPSSFYFQHPIFRNLKAIKNNRAYVVNQEVWSAAGILGANKVLDDLFKYLPEGT